MQCKDRSSYGSSEADSSPIDVCASSTMYGLLAASDCGSNSMPLQNCHLETDWPSKHADLTNQHSACH